jgi:ribosome-associated protein YbcJ (S4-like RNA binding protein)
MARIMGLKTQVEVEVELENRRSRCLYRKDILLYQNEKKMQEYQEFVAKNPHLFKKLTP